MVDTLDKKGDKGIVSNEDLPTIRIILKSQEVKNLDYVAGKIISLAKESDFEVRGPRYMPNKVLRITTRKGPCGNGTATFDRFELRIHTRIIDIKCNPSNVADITNFKIKPGVDVTMSKVYSCLLTMFSSGFISCVYRLLKDGYTRFMPSFFTQD